MRGSMTYWNPASQIARSGVPAGGGAHFSGSGCGTTVSAIARASKISGSLTHGIAKSPGRRS